MSDPSGTDVRDPSCGIGLMLLVKAVKRLKDLSGSSVLLVHRVAVLTSLIFCQSRERAVQMLAALPRVARLLTADTTLILLSRKCTAVDMSQTDPVLWIC